MTAQDIFMLIVILVGFSAMVVALVMISGEIGYQAGELRKINKEMRPTKKKKERKLPRRKIGNVSP